jgi:serine/threonine protein kinase
MSTESLKPGQVIAERYRIECLLGRGGMGSVYRAAQLPMERPVAIKVLVDQEAASPVHLKRFEREARALSKLSHPNTVRLFEFGTTTQGQPFLAMELLDGIDLQRRLSREGRVPCDQALRICLQVLRSLEEAHSYGIVHRDIKPANIFLCPIRGQPSFVKVLDFGIASRLNRTPADTQLTADGTVIGSVPYMSPEQAEGADIGSFTDLYAVGVVLFEMLAGTLPFRAKTLAGLYVAKATQPALHLSDVCTDLEAPAALHRLADELLLRDPARRPSSARSVAERIEALLEVVSARPRVPAHIPRTAGAHFSAETEPLTAARAREDDFPEGDASNAISAEGLAHTFRSPARLDILYRSGVALALLIAGVTAWRFRGADQLPTLRPVATTSPPAIVPTTPVLDDTVEPAVTPALPAVMPQPEPPTPTKRSAAETIERKALEGSPTRRAQPVAEGATPSGALPASPASNDLQRPYPTVAAVRAARDAGQISQLDSNALIRALRQLRLDARTRAGNEYKAGRIGLEELKRRQQQIEEAFEDPAP